MDSFLIFLYILLKHYLFRFLFIFWASAIFGQNNCVVTGGIYDKNQPIEYANILFYQNRDSSKVFKSAISDSLGRFSLFLPIDNYLVKIQFIGYKTLVKDINIVSNGTNLDLGKIYLEVDAKLLNVIEVRSKKNVIEKTQTGFIVNTSAMISQSGISAIDLLRSTPTVVVDPEGAIFLRGKTPQIFVNGRNSGITNIDQILASSIEIIEIINSPSAQYDAEAEGGIINIKLKKNRQEGTNGALALGMGYGAKLRANSSFLISHKAGKLNVGLAYDNRFAGRTRSVTGDRINYKLVNQYFLSQNRQDERVDKNQNLKVNFDYALNSKNTISLEAIGSYVIEDNNETIKNLTSTKLRSFVSQNSRQSLEYRKENVLEFALNYTKLFINPRKSLKTSLSTSIGNSKEDTDINTVQLFENLSVSGLPAYQQTFNYANRNVSNLQLDFVQPLTSRSLLELGYKVILRVFNSNFQSKYKVNDLFVINPFTSNIFDFNENIHAIYGQFSSLFGEKTKPIFKYNFGLRAEGVTNKGKAINNSLVLDNQYFNLFPSASVSYFISENETLKLNLGKRINRPSLGNLNPFTDITDSLTQRSGNPNLKPELVNIYEIGYNKDWPKGSFSSSIFYRNSVNIIQPYTILKPDGILFTKPLNFGKGSILGFESLFSAPINHFWDTNISITLFQQNINGGNVEPNLNNIINSWNGKLINNFTFGNYGKLQFISIYNSPIATPQGTRIAVYNTDFGYQHKLNKGRLGLIITDIFNQQKSGNDWSTADFKYSRIGKVDSRAILLTFAYTFKGGFKDKLMENKFSND
jgi:outer membrane receptor protein involved in Fe transport